MNVGKLCHGYNLWIQNPSKSEVIGRCGGDEKKTKYHAEPTKSKAKQIKSDWLIQPNTSHICSLKPGDYNGNIYCISGRFTHLITNILNLLLNLDFL